MTTTPKVFTAIAAVMQEIGASGISKGRNNSQQGYAFRGIDDVLNELSPVLAKHKLCVLPRMIGREVVERQTRNGGALFNVTVEAEFDLVCAEDGSMHTIRTYGEAMDSADKATNKAMSAAYKYAAIQAFCIPTEGDNDADATTHDVAPRSQEPARSTYSDHVAAVDGATTLAELQTAFLAAKADKSLTADQAADIIRRKDELKAKLTPADDFPGDQQKAA